MARKKKKRTIFWLVLLLILGSLAGGAYLLGVNLFAAVPLSPAAISTQAAAECQAKITKMLIDETLAFNYQKTRDLVFGEDEITSWLNRNLSDPRLREVRVEIEKGLVTFRGRFEPLLAGEKAGALRSLLSRRFAGVGMVFSVTTRPRVQTNRVVFEPLHITWGRITVPPKLMPDLPDALGLNPFEKRIRTIQGVRIEDHALVVTVYAD